MMRTKDEIETIVANLQARQKELEGFWTDYLTVPVLRQDRNGREPSLHDGADSVTMWRDEWMKCQRVIDVLKWTTGEWEHLPWR